jgi:hypothetical protein
MPVNVKNDPSNVVTFGGIKKSETMSGSPAIAIWTTANGITSNEKKTRVEEAEAMMKRAELLQSDMVFLDDVLGFERFIIYIYRYIYI